MKQLFFDSEHAVKRIERIQELLRGQPLSLQEIADGLFISKRYTSEYINYLMEIGSIHIADFRRDERPANNRRYLALYKWGDGVNAERPEMERKPKPVQPMDPDERRDRAAALKKAKLIQPFRDWSAAWIPNRENV